MKILSGQARGRRLKTPPNARVTRPILGRIRKSLFDILRPRMKGSKFLDLYAGSGAVGFEAVSEGASLVALVDNDHTCSRLIRENIEHLGFCDKAQFFRMDVLKDLRALPAPFDIIFMGPPYVDPYKKPLALSRPTLENVRANQLLAPTGIVVVQHHKKEDISDTPGWEIFRQEHYGDSVLTFFKPV